MSEFLTHTQPGGWLHIIHLELAPSPNSPPHFLVSELFGPHLSPGWDPPWALRIWHLAQRTLISGRAEETRTTQGSECFHWRGFRGELTPPWLPEMGIRGSSAWTEAWRMTEDPGTFQTEMQCEPRSL